jgi:hypothetical protein
LSAAPLFAPEHRNLLKSRHYVGSTAHRILVVKQTTERWKYKTFASLNKSLHLFLHYKCDLHRKLLLAAYHRKSPGLSFYVMMLTGTATLAILRCLLVEMAQLGLTASFPLRNGPGEYVVFSVDHFKLASLE